VAAVALAALAGAPLGYAAGGAAGRSNVCAIDGADHPPAASIAAQKRGHQFVFDRESIEAQLEKCASPERTLQTNSTAAGIVPVIHVANICPALRR
jgi:hypothetical protein